MPNQIYLIGECPRIKCIKNLHQFEVKIWKQVIIDVHAILEQLGFDNNLIKIISLASPVFGFDEIICSWLRFQGTFPEQQS